jgi:nucleoside-diphosphate-sugar epimerase
MSGHAPPAVGSGATGIDGGAAGTASQSTVARSEPHPAVVVTGAGSQVGYFLIPRLCAAGWRVIAVSRRPEAQAVAGFGAHWAGAGQAQWVRADLEQPAVAWAQGCLAWIHLGPLRLAAARAPQAAAAGVQRIVAFGSTSRFTKAASASPREQRIVADLEAGERELARAAAALGIAATVLRPTLIYGAGLDRNVMVIAQAIRRFGFFPLVGGGRGLRQPVHADDLAQACVAALDLPPAPDRAYDLSGAEVLTYRAMVERVFAALGRAPRLLPVPLAAIGVALWGLARLSRYRDFNVEMARRMSLDMTFAHDAATRDLGYRPRRFAPVVDAPR